jgi:hypothetical protein
MWRSGGRVQPWRENSGQSRGCQGRWRCGGPVGTADRERPRSDPPRQPHRRLDAPLSVRIDGESRRSRRAPRSPPRGRRPFGPRRPCHPRAPSPAPFGPPRPRPAPWTGRRAARAPRLALRARRRSAPLPPTARASVSSSGLTSPTFARSLPSTLWTTRSAARGLSFARSSVSGTRTPNITPRAACLGPGARRYCPKAWWTSKPAVPPSPLAEGVEGGTGRLKGSLSEQP